MPDYWYSQRANRENAENVSKEKHRLNSRIVAEKKPYFMIYVYPTLNVEMKRWINQCNTDCAKKFDVSKTDDLVLDTEEKRVFMEYREKGFKVSSNPCTINRLCWIFEKELPNASVAKPTKEFDYRILKFDTDYSERDYSAISIIYKKYLCELDAFRQNARLSGYSRDDLRYGEETFKEKFRGECQKICTNEQELCNIILDLCYSKETSKQFVWDIVGDVIVENLMAKKRKISFPKSGGEEFEFGGEKFDIITIDC